MKKRILELLATKFVGVSDKILDRVAEKLAKTATTEEEATTAVEGVTFQQVLESYGDSRATEASVTAVKNYETKHKLKDGKAVEDEPEPDPNDDTPAWAKALIDANKALTDRLNAIEKGNVTESRRTQLNKIIGKLPSSLKKAYERTPVEGMTDDEFAELTSSITSEVDGILAETNRKGAIFGRPKETGITPKATEKEATEDELKAVTDRLNI